MRPKNRKTFRLPAIRLVQNSSHPLYLFSLTGDELLSIADVSRVSRDDVGNLIGYQRSEVKNHVQEIVNYLNTSNVVFPNSIILSISSKVKFKQDTKTGGEAVTAGTLEIPVPGPSEAKPAWIVDGQQRVLAISKSSRRDLALPINAFIADDIELQRDQFIRVNNTKPLPNDLLRELLPSVLTQLPSKLEAQKVPSILCDMLNRDPESPFYGLIHRASTPSKEKHTAVVAALSIVKMIQESLSSPRGCLFVYHNIATGETDFQGIHTVLCTYWKAVRRIFPDAWGLPPVKSRLMHGAGIRAMGRLMDRIMPHIYLSGVDSVETVGRELETIFHICRWTKGKWEELGNLPWNKIQNMSGDITLLADLLIRKYEEAKAIRT